MPNAKTLHEMAEERRARREREQAEYAEADMRGELWTLQAAIYPKRAFCVLYKGHVDDTGPLESQHRDAGGILGPCLIVGDKRSAMQQTLGMLKVDEITIRVIDN